MITFCDDKYKLTKRVGHGSFGAVFLTVKLNQNGQSMTSMEYGGQGGGVAGGAPGTQSSFAENNNNNNNNIIPLPGMVTSNDGVIPPQTQHEQNGSPNTNNNALRVVQQQQSPTSSPVVNNGSFVGIQAMDSHYGTNMYNQYGGGIVPRPSQQLQQQFITKLEGLPKNATAANPGDSARSHLTREYRFYKYMHDCCENLLGIPQVYDFGVEGQYRYLVMDQCGPSLDALFRAKSKNFTPLTILRIAQQMISRIQFVHALGLVHRDIKPENWCMGMHEKCHVVYLIDFGLSKMFLSKKNGEHVAIVTGKRLAGTARYASIWTHEGISQARRDDMEGIWFTLLYLCRGGFPWDTGPSTQNIEQYIGSVKKKVPPDQLCKNVPEPLKTFMLSFISHVRGLEFAQEPDYYKLKQMCIGALHQLGRSEKIESLSDFCWFKAPSSNDHYQNHQNNGEGNPNSSTSGGAAGTSSPRLGGANADGVPSRSSYANNIDSSFASAQSQCLGMGAQSSMGGGFGFGGGGAGLNNSGAAMTNISFRQSPGALFTPKVGRPLSPGASPNTPQPPTSPPKNFNSYNDQQFALDPR